MADLIASSASTIHIIINVQEPTAPRTRTMQFYWGQTKLLGNVRIPDLSRLLQGAALDPLSGQAA